MIRNVYDSTGMRLLRTEEAEPVCGENFCERCGDCLHCYGGDPCYVPSDSDDDTPHILSEHFWVVYEDDLPVLEVQNDR